MITKILDLHVHSKYSRACSKHLELPLIAKTCETRGIDILVTGDMTHPQWFAHMKEHLVEDTAGVYKLKDNSSKTRFILGTEVAVIKKDKGKTRRVHHCLFAPNLEVVEKFNKRLEEGGFNLKADGRPILGMTSKQLLQFCLDIDPRMIMIPAHVWTPWFGLFGSKGGYDSLEEAFDELTPHINAVETGLSSDPRMNWRCSWLDDIALVSNSDAHSPQKLGREANVIAFDNEEDITYDEIFRILTTKDSEKFLYTIEFYPEEGKYHTDGHRDCKFSCEPEESAKLGNLCPECKKPLTIGVLNRVVELADRTEEEAEQAAKEKNFIPYKSLVPLPEILADTFECGVATKRVKTVYDDMIAKLGSEFYILLHASIDDIETATTAQIANAIQRVREGNIHIVPGYDGEFGIVKVFANGEDRGGTKQTALI